MEQLGAISDINDPDEIRVVLFINNRLVHAPLPAIVRHLNEHIDSLDEQIAALKARVDDLSNT